MVLWDSLYSVIIIRFLLLCLLQPGQPLVHLHIPCNIILNTNLQAQSSWNVYNILAAKVGLIKIVGVFIFWMAIIWSVKKPKLNSHNLLYILVYVYMNKALFILISPLEKGWVCVCDRPGRGPSLCLGTRHWCPLSTWGRPPHQSPPGHTDSWTSSAAGLYTITHINNTIPNTHMVQLTTLLSSSKTTFHFPDSYYT